KELTGYVLDRRHRHVALGASPPANTSSIEDRLHGYRAAFSQRGLGLGGQHLLTGLTSGFPNPEGRIPADYEPIRAFVGSHDSVTSFVASEYPIALIIRDVLRDLSRLEATMITSFYSPRVQSIEPRLIHFLQNERET